MKPVIKVNTSRQHHYPIHIGTSIDDLIQSELSRLATTDRGFMIVDENVFTHHNEKILTLCKSLFERFEYIVIPPGERSKSEAELLRIIHFLLENGIKRTHPVLVVGGGVVGDLGGFASSITLRGVPFIQMPTTLLSMVDSSVGGKTGINHDTGKNLIGSFYQPEAVFIDLTYLMTLPRREWASGLGEIIKYAAIWDPGMFDEILNLLDNDVPASDPQWIPIISKCVSIKAEIVQQDELESGIRSFLNFGHTFAHALERALNYSHVLHGEAVYLGMIAATHLSNLTGSNLDIERLKLFKKHLDVTWPDSITDLEHLIYLMSFDKKNTSDSITFILLEDWGKPFKKSLIDTDILKEALKLTIEDTSK